MQSAAQLANLIEFQPGNEYALRGGQALAAIQAQLKTAKQELADTLAKLATLKADSIQAQRLELIAEQIAHTRTRLNSDACTDKDRASLNRSLTALLEEERKWSGRPDPGTLKPRQEPARQRQSYAEPTLASPAPQPAPNPSTPQTGA